MGRHRVRTYNGEHVSMLCETFCRYVTLKREPRDGSAYCPHCESTVPVDRDVSDPEHIGR